jgi:hypothetical protein
MDLKEFYLFKQMNSMSFLSNQQICIFQTNFLSPSFKLMFTFMFVISVKRLLFIALLLIALLFAVQFFIIKGENLLLKGLYAV